MRRTLPALAVVLLLAGCSTQDPFERPGSWQPIGANELNLRQMAADQGHLLEGVGTERERAATAIAPIDRLDAGDRPELPAVNTRNR